MSSQSISIPKLQGSDDFPQWKRRMIAVLQDKDYDLVISYDQQTFHPISGKTLDPINSRIDMKAKGLIELNVSDSILPHITSELTANDYWIKLHDMFQSSSLSAVVCRLRNLVSCSQGGMAIQEYIGMVEQRARDLRGCGIEICDRLVCALVIANLDSRFSAVATALDSQDFESLPISKITSVLLNEESRQGQELTNFQPHAMISRRLRCRIHPQLSHTNDQCFTQHPHLRPKDWKPRQLKYSSDKQQEFSSYSCALSASTSFSSHSEWYFDSGCSSHMVSDISELSQFKKTSQGTSVQLGDDSIIPSAGVGECVLKLGEHKVKLNNVLLVPDLKKNLISPGEATKSGLAFLMSGDYLTVFDEKGFQPPSGHVIARVKRDSNNLYRLRFLESSSRANFASSPKAPISLSKWHLRLAHTNFDDIRRLETSGAIGKILDNGKTTLCEPCILGKLARKPFKSRDPNKPMSPGDLIVSDLMGPFPTPSTRGHRYFVTYIDYCTRFCTVALLKSKSEQECNLKRFITSFSNQHGIRIKNLQTDNGGEYCSSSLRLWLDEQGIHHRTTVPGDSESNGLAERMNRTLTDMALSMLAQANLPQIMFSHAIQTACHVFNRRPHSHLQNRISPFEALFKQVPDLHYLRVFGCTAYSHIHDHKRSKLD
jgi:transposase InsO family protein